MDTDGLRDGNKSNIMSDNTLAIDHAHVNENYDDDGNSSNDDALVTSTKIMRQRKRSSSSNSHCRIYKPILSGCDSSADINVDSDETNASENSLRKQIPTRRSASPSTNSRDNSFPRRQISRFLSIGLSSGYAQYQKGLLEVPLPRDYGEASSDDLSSEWDSDVPETQQSSKVTISLNLKKLLCSTLVPKYLECYASSTNYYKYLFSHSI